MNAIVSAALPCLLLLASSAPSALGAEVAPVYVEETEILYLESYPVQVVLAVSGTVPTPCHEVDYQVDASADRIDVQLWSVADPETICITVLEPFEVSIPLGSFETADLPVTLNGGLVGRVSIGVEPSGSQLVGAGWSFGYCGGYCAADLVLEDGALTLTGSERGLLPLYENRGTLTEVGQDRLDAALAELDGVDLEPVYGCPDCADQGAAYLSLLRGGAVERVEMGYAAPPDELSELYAIAISIIETLQLCDPSELVSPAHDCAPYER